MFIRVSKNLSREEFNKMYPEPVPVPGIEVPFGSVESGLAFSTIVTDPSSVLESVVTEGMQFFLLSQDSIGVLVIADTIGGRVFLSSVDSIADAYDKLQYMVDAWFSEFNDTKHFLSSEEIEYVFELLSEFDIELPEDWYI